MISIIHPSRSRPEKSFDTISRWLERALDNPEYVEIEVIISLDYDDPFLKEYHQVYGNCDHRFYLTVNENRSAIDAVNVAAAMSRGSVLVVVSDDTDCPIGWDDIITRDTNSRNPLVVKYADGIQNEIVTMPVMNRRFYNRFGYIYNPIYKHGWCDTELTEVAKRTGALIKRLDVLFKHNHYSVTGEPRDAIYERSDAHHDEGKRIFYERLKRNFDL